MAKRYERKNHKNSLNRKNPIIIAIEGVDGAGKTFLCKNIKKRLIPKIKNNKKIIVIKTPYVLSYIRSIFDDLDWYGNRLLYYIVSNIVDIEKLKNYKLIFLDRYFYSTFAYHYFLIKEKRKVLNILKIIHIYPPHMVIILKPTYKNLKMRLTLRTNIHDYIENKIISKKFYDFFYNEGLEIFKKYTILNNYKIFENNTKEDLEKIIEFLKDTVKNRYRIS